MIAQGVTTASPETPGPLLLRGNPGMACMLHFSLLLCLTPLDVTPASQAPVSKLRSDGLPRQYTLQFRLSCVDAHVAANIVL